MLSAKCMSRCQGMVIPRDLEDERRTDPDIVKRSIPDTATSGVTMDLPDQAIDVVGQQCHAQCDATRSQCIVGAEQQYCEALWNDCERSCAASQGKRSLLTRQTIEGYCGGKPDQCVFGIGNTGENYAICPGADQVGFTNLV